MTEMVDRLALDKDSVCPRCGKQGVMRKIQILNCTSRTDNKTMICVKCGTDEAFGGCEEPWATQINPFFASLNRQ